MPGGFFSLREIAYCFCLTAHCAVCGKMVRRYYRLMTATAVVAGNQIYRPSTGQYTPAHHSYQRENRIFVLSRPQVMIVSTCSHFLQLQRFSSFTSKCTRVSQQDYKTLSHQSGGNKQQEDKIQGQMRRDCDNIKLVLDNYVIRQILFRKSNLFCFFCFLMLQSLVTTDDQVATCR